LRIEVPRGHYVPRFYAAKIDAPIELIPLPAAESMPNAAVTTAPDAALSLSILPKKSKPGAIQMYIWTFLAGIVVGAIALTVFYRLRHDEPLPAARTETNETELERKFWSALFPRNGKTIIVPGDSGLVMYETISGKEVNLTDYINGAYPQADPNLTPMLATHKDMAANLGRRRYTSFVDLDLSTRLTQLPEWSQDHVSTTFSRDLRPADVSRSNLILIGSREANPWVSLVEPSMNFVLTRGPSGEFYFLNRHPRAGELPEYRPVLNSGGIGAADLYGEVAYLRNPSGDGMVLVLSGLWMSGTQSAGNFVLNHEQFTNWLKSIANADGSIPPFEVLISTKNLQGSSPYSLIIAKRVMTMPKQTATH
jgi:hypothetical protein